MSVLVRAALIFGAVFFGMLALLGAVKAEDTVPVAVLVVSDTSGSITPAELRLQRDGIAKVLESEQFRMAVKANGRVALAMMDFGSAAELVLPWTVVTADDLRGLANRVRAIRRFAYGDTCVAKMFRAAKIVMDQAPAADRRVVDVAGDGPDNCMVQMPGPSKWYTLDTNIPEDAAKWRDELVKANVTVNGLPIHGQEPKIEGWYEQNVMGGDDSFIEPASSPDDFLRAMLKKLVREIS